MELELIAEGLIGLGICGGVGIFTLSKIGLIHFGKNNTPNGQAKMHDKIDTNLKILSDTQLIQTQILKGHEKRLDDDKGDFKEVKKDISDIRVSIATLAAK